MQGIQCMLLQFDEDAVNIAGQLLHRVLMGNKDSTSTIDVDAEWVRELENKAYYEAKTLRDQNSTICKVSEILRNVQPEAYEPVIVSLGPYHHHKPHLQAMNQLKWSLLYKLLKKGSENSLRSYLILIKEKKDKVRNIYSDQAPIDMLEDRQFVEMMLRDCVFVIMILWFWKSKEGLEAIEAPILRSRRQSWSVVARDMLLLENQLPFFLLEALFDKAFPNKSGQLKPWISQFFSSTGFVENKKLQVPEDAKQVHHILHLFYLSIVPLNTSSSNVVARQTVLLEDSRMVRVPSATQLEATRGIKIKRKEKAKSFLDITFEEEGVLEIPQIEINDDTDVLFRNLIAFEQCQKSAAIGYDISTYAWFLSCIAATVNDVELLQQREIIIDRLRNQRMGVAHLLGKLCEGVLVDHKNCYVSRVFKEVAKDREIPYRRCSWLELAISRRYQIREPQVGVGNFNEVAKDRQIRYVNLRLELVRRRMSMKSR